AVRRGPRRDPGTRPLRRVRPRRRRPEGARLHRGRRRRRSQTLVGASMMRRCKTTGGPMRRHVKQLLLAVTIALGGSAIAADLPDYLPNETLIAFGIEGLNQHEAKAQPYIDEWERLDLTALLEAAFAEDAGDEMPEVP